MRIKIRAQELYQCMMAMLSSVLMCLLLSPFMATELSSVLLLIIPIVVAGLVIIFCMTGVRGKLLSSGIVIAVGVLLLIRDKEQLFQSFMGKYFHWLVAKGEWDETAILSYQLVTVIGLSILVAVGALLIERRLWIKGVCSALLLSVVLYQLLRKQEMNKWMVCLILFYLLLFALEVLQKRDRRLLVWVMPFLMIYLVTLLVIPTNKEPYQWNMVKQLYAQVQGMGIALSQGFESLFGLRTEDFALSFAGFSDSGKLGGNIIDTDREVMTVTTGKDMRTNLYLGGSIYDTFTDNEWQMTADSVFDAETNRRIDLIETAYAVNQFAGAARYDCIRETTIGLRYEDFYTKYVFMPLKSWEIMETGGKNKYEYQGDNLLFAKGAGYHTGYQLHYMQLNVDHAKFYDMIEAAKSFAEREKTEEEQKLLTTVNYEYLHKQSEDYVSLEMLQKHEKWIYDTYLDYEISQKVKDLTDRITQSCTSDVEKLKAIEAYLSAFRYTKTPQKIPEDEDFLEYFLFTSQEGYCTYFATAFTLMARYEGIPTRYVQGFCIPAKQSDSEIRVSTNMAHAWPEVYMTGVGWIPFEPTPSFDMVRYTPWAVVTAYNEEAVTHYNGVSYQEAMAMALEQQQAEAGQKAEMPDLDIPVEKKESAAGRIILMVVLLLVMVICIYFAIDQLIMRNKYRRMTVGERVVYELNSMLTILAYLGYSLEQGETLKELQQRITGQERLGEFEWRTLALYQQWHYGNRQLMKEDEEAARREKKELLTLLKAKKGKEYYLLRLSMILFHK